MAQADIHRITWTATQAGYSFLDFGRRIGAAEYSADDAFLAIHAFTGTVHRCWTLADVGHWLATVEDAIASPLAYA